MDRPLSHVDPQIAKILQGELQRQQQSLVLIPSENYTSTAVLEAQSSVLTNKYAEGAPGARYYNGCRFADQAESLAIERAKTLFGAEHANVQPHSGSQANLSVYYALLDPGATVLAMDLAHGGHLTHGQPLNYSGRTYKFVFYGVDRKTEAIDIETVARLAREHKPKLIVAGASAYPRTIDFDRFAEIAREVGAYLLADVSHIAGLIAARCHPDPVPPCDLVTSTTHKTLRGPRGALILCKETYASKIDRAVFPGVQSGPFMNTIAAKAVCFHEASTDEFRRYGRQIVTNALALAEALAAEGLRLVSGGTDNHLMLVDLNPLNLTGKKVADLLESVGIVVNKNVIPFDTKSPMVTSGIRLGTPAVTSRGMGIEEMRTIGRWIGQLIHNPSDTALATRIQGEVRAMCQAFPIYPSVRYV